MSQRSLPLALLTLGLGLPALAQVPHFADGPAFGGSQVFSEGLNPLGNCSRFDKIDSGWFLSCLDGGQQAKDDASLLDDMGSASPRRASGALPKLQDAPWALRQRAYGLNLLSHGISLSYTREETSSLLASPDLDPLHRDSPAGLALNTTSLALRTVRVDRVAAGAGSGEQGKAYGFLLRAERFYEGHGTAALNPAPGQRDLEGDLLDRLPTSSRRTTWGLDLGMTLELSQGWRMGLTVDQINARRLWDVNERAQGRLGFQVDLGRDMQFSLERDLNRVERVPFPVKQLGTVASLRIATGASSWLLVGAEHRKVGDSTVTRGGATWMIRSGRYHLGLGFQYSEDKPLKGLAVRVN